MSEYLSLKRFGDINISDPFFDSLKDDYQEFTDWFRRKQDEKAYVMEYQGFIQGFLYLKVEEGPITDISPILNVPKALKVGTLKINPHGTRLGERFIKKALDHALIANVDACYVTVFRKHAALVELLMKYGFSINGMKNTRNGDELVLVKRMKVFSNDIYLDYPLILASGVQKYLLAIYPEYHTKMFPDSILNNETYDILEDVSHTNSIHKIYVCAMPVHVLRPRDIVVIYRTKDDMGPAEYRSVATSICVVEEVKHKNEFKNFNDFYGYANAYSIFDKTKLFDWYKNRTCYTIKMTYNVALKRRLTRKRLADEVGISRDDRWSFLALNDNQFKLILEKGDVDECNVIY